MKMTALLPAVSLLLTATAMGQTILVDTFGPTDEFNADSSWLIVGPDFSLLSQTDVAARFESQSPLLLNSAEIALNNTSGDTSIDIRIFQGEGGVPSNLVLEETQISIPAGSLGSIINAQFSNTLLLQANTEYWISLSAPNDALSGWNLNSQGNTGFAFSKDAGDTWFLTNEATPAFRLIAVPEPSHLWSALIPLAFSLYRRPSRRP